MKIFFRNIHLYLGLAAGLVVMTTCFTGAVLVFEEELQHIFHHDRYYVQPGKDRLPFQQVVENFQQKVPGGTITGMKFYNEPDRSAEILFTQTDKTGTPVRKTALKKPAPGRAESNRRTAFINPYSGEIIELYSYRETFFYTMFDLHRWLLSGATGKLVVGICTLIFLFILVTGIILWWPKNKAILKSRLAIKSNTGWKRLNHDFHIVLGFYSAIFLFVFAFTGLAWSFEWFNKGIYTITNSPQQGPRPPKSIYLGNAQTIRIDDILKKVEGQLTSSEFISVNLPKDSLEAVSISFLSRDAALQTATDIIYLDQYTGERIGQLYFKDRSLGAKVRSSFKPIHTGSVFGIPSKIIAFITCLLGVTFPVTGTIMWINRIRKKKKRTKYSEKVELMEEVEV